MTNFQLPPRFKNLTQALFQEFEALSTVKDAQAPFTLASYHKPEKGYLSLYLLYMEYETEYEAAVGILGSWQHWEKLCKCKWFKPYRDRWEQERETRAAAIAMRTLVDRAAEGDVSAAKAILAEQKKPSKGRGRPSNKEITTNSRDEREIEGILDRFQVVGGKKGQ